MGGQLFDEHCSLLWLFNPGTTPQRQATVVKNFLNRFLFSGSRDENYLKETSYFGELSYAITPQWQVTLGVRIADVQVQVDDSPKYTGSVALSYDFEIAGFQATARGEHYVVARQWRGPDKERPTPRYQKTDLRLTLRRSNYDLAVYANDAFDEVVAYERNQQGYNFGRARTLGLEDNWRLNGG